jgi:hypothetical protein
MKASNPFYSDLPLQKISELFSVNHFIVAQCKQYLLFSIQHLVIYITFDLVNPHVAPFLHKSNKKPSILRTCINFVLRLFKEEVQHRCSQVKISIKNEKRRGSHKNNS